MRRGGSALIYDRHCHSCTFCASTEAVVPGVLSAQLQE